LNELYNLNEFDCEQGTQFKRSGAQSRSIQIQSSFMIESTSVGGTDPRCPRIHIWRNEACRGSMPFCRGSPGTPSRIRGLKKRALAYSLMDQSGRELRPVTRKTVVTCRLEAPESPPADLNALPANGNLQQVQVPAGVSASNPSGGKNSDRGNNSHRKLGQRGWSEDMKNQIAPHTHNQSTHGQAQALTLSMGQVYPEPLPRAPIIRAENLARERGLAPWG
jgi:hypothetical protein